jgi:hypothetical protein
LSVSLFSLSVSSVSFLSPLSGLSCLCILCLSLSVFLSFLSAGLFLYGLYGLTLVSLYEKLMVDSKIMTHAKYNGEIKEKIISLMLLNVITISV